MTLNVRAMAILANFSAVCLFVPVNGDPVLPSSAIEASLEPALFHQPSNDTGLKPAGLNITYPDVKPVLDSPEWLDAARKGLDLNISD